MSKLKQLEKQFPFLKKHKTGSDGLSVEGFPVEQLDLIAILKASQEISENILPEKLNEALIRIVMQQAGAGKGYLLFEYDGRLSVVSEAVSNMEIVVKVHDTPLEPDYRMLPEKIFQFVKRTGSTIIIDEASQDKVFGSDKYIEVSRPRSIACLPIIKQGKHLGIIYLENNFVPGAFSADKIAVLKILTSQAAISIENAFYYREIKKLNETLEQRVKERTDALTKTQAALQFSEKKYREIVEEAGYGVYSSDYKGNFTYLNPTVKKIIGYTENEFLGKSFLEVIDPEWKEKVAKFYKEQFDNKVQETLFSFPIITKSGEKKWVEQTVTQLKEGDWIKGHNAIVRDITERKRTEDELKNSNDRFLKIFENNPIGMTLSNIETRDFANVNAVFCEYYGYTKEEAIGKRGEDLKLLTPESQEKIGSILKKDGKVNNIEVLARKKNGETFWVLVSVEMIIINGKTFGLSSFININERKKAEEKLKEYQYFFNNSHDLITIANENHFEIINPNFQKVLGYSEKELLEKRFLDFIHPDDVNATLQDIEKVKTGVETINFTNRYRKKDGSYLLFEWNVTSDPITGKFYASARDISDRKKAEDELNKSNERFLKIFEHNPIGMVISSLETNQYQYVNDVFVENFGFSREEIVGKTSVDINIIDVEIREKMVSLLKQEGYIKDLEILVRKKNGETFWALCSIQILLIGGKKFALVSFHNISERKKVEEKLKEYQYFFNNSHDLITIASESHFEIINPNFQKVLGYSEKELLEKRFQDFIHPDDINASLQEIEKLKTGLETINFANRYRKKNGSYLLFEWNVTSDPTTGKFYASARDITDRKKAEDELKSSNERFLKIFENNSFGMVLVNLETNKFQYVNGFFLKKFGYTNEEVIGKTATEITIIEAESYEKVLTLFKQQGYVTDFEALVRKKNGELFWASSSLQIIKINGVDFFLSSFFDITERKKAEEIIKQKSEELASTNKELEQFVYVASHDLQEPLRTISNFVGLLEKKYSGITDKDSGQYLQFIVDAAARMQNLIKDLLDLSRIGRNVIYTVVDCNEVFKEVIANMEASVKESNAKITSATLPVLKGNTSELKQLFQNLISNAIKFRKKDVSPEIHISVEDKNTEYLFAIKDNGIGIEEKSINKLFVIFQRLNAATEYPGTGIGLATCKKIIDLHNGKIWVESKFGEGSTFYFTLPKEKLTGKHN